MDGVERVGPAVTKPGYRDGMPAELEVLLENDPDDNVADGGVTVLDVWRQDAKRVLGL